MTGVTVLQYKCAVFCCMQEESQQPMMMQHYSTLLCYIKTLHNSKYFWFTLIFPQNNTLQCWYFLMRSHWSLSSAAGLWQCKLFHMYSLSDFSILKVEREYSRLKTIKTKILKNVYSVSEADGGERLEDSRWEKASMVILPGHGVVDVKVWI